MYKSADGSTGRMRPSSTQRRILASFSLAQGTRLSSRFTPSTGAPCSISSAQIFEPSGREREWPIFARM
ncbi:hypothetical protein D3C85_1691640 [compost metagenome]